jgi:hypothetical protein
MSPKNKGLSRGEVKNPRKIYVQCSVNGTSCKTLGCENPPVKLPGEKHFRPLGGVLQRSMQCADPADSGRIGGGGGEGLRGYGS